MTPANCSANPADQITRRVLCEARVAAGLTQRALAAKLGCPQSFIGDIERGARRVGRAEFLAIARILGRDPGELAATIFNECAR